MQQQRSMLRPLFLTLSILPAVGFNARNASAQDSYRARYADTSSLVIADSMEAKIIDRRVPLRFPMAERQAGDEAAFTTVFVLDSAGRVEMPTVRFVGTASPAFRRELCQWLKRIRVAPVVRAGIARRAFVVAPFRFELDGGTLRSQPIETGEAIRMAVIADGLPAASLAFEPLPRC